MDSGHELGWKYSNERNNVPKATTVGFLTYIDSLYLEFTSTLATGKGRLNSLAIPIGCIQSIQEVRLTK